jgi:hypothetical protein
MYIRPENPKGLPHAEMNDNCARNIYLPVILNYGRINTIIE